MLMMAPASGVACREHNHIPIKDLTITRSINYNLGYIYVATT
jgi:hypothetical protein